MFTRAPWSAPPQLAVRLRRRRRLLGLAAFLAASIGTAVSPREARADGADDDADSRDLATMKRTLRSYTHDYTLRTDLAWTTFGVGIVASAGGMVLSSQGNDLATAGDVLSWTGLILVHAGDFAMPNPTLHELELSLDDGLARGLPAAGIRQQIEVDLASAATREGYQRRVWGAIGVSASVFALGIDGIATYATSTSHPLDGHLLAEEAGLDFALLVLLGHSIHVLVAPGPVECALDDYERAAGRRVRPLGLRDVGVRIIPVPGGAAAGVGGQF